MVCGQVMDLARSIIQPEGYKGGCFICKRRNNLELHHVFGAANRRLSDKDGLTVYLCHDCHNEPPNGVHFNRAIDIQLKQLAEQRWMEYYGKSEDDFRRRYGRSWL